MNGDGEVEQRRRGHRSKGQSESKASGGEIYYESGEPRVRGERTRARLRRWGRG
jgi:hypothetical protein